MTTSTTTVELNSVFSTEELELCVKFRTPSLVRTNSGTVLVIARCCGDNMCENNDKSVSGTVGDNNKDAVVAMKSSGDGGFTWENFTILSPEEPTGFANGFGIYDRFNDRVLVQYQYYPGGSTAPAVNTSYYQMTSEDDGVTWTSPVDITSQLSNCNPDPGNMMCQSAGNKVQTETGRLLWAAHDHADHVCVWYSDDGGDTYSTSSLFAGNEVSMAVTGANRTQLLMNGRGTLFDWQPHRADYWSEDGGATWSDPVESPLLEDVTADGEADGCERSLVNVDDVLYSAEPKGPKRTHLFINCSTDYGVTWTNGRNINNGDDGAGYSDIVGLNNGKLLVVWENADILNFYAAQIDTDWCTDQY